MARSSARNRKKARERKKELQRCLDLPSHLHPYGSVPFPRHYQDTHAIINAEQYLPWTIEEERQPCRAYHPEDVWEIGTLKQAIYNELEGNDSMHSQEEVMGPPARSQKGKEKAGQGRRMIRREDCLNHIFQCWNANMKRGESAGPEFLIHFLRGDYEGSPSLECLEGRDERIMRIVRRAAVGLAFHVLLGRLRRIAYGSFAYGALDGEYRILNVERVDSVLEDVAHAEGKEVKTIPRITGVDFLDENYFEGKVADESDYASSESWTRTVLIIVPTVCVDNFLDYSEVVINEDEDQHDEEGEPDIEDDEEQSLYEEESNEEMDFREGKAPMEVAYDSKYDGMQPTNEEHPEYVECEDGEGNKIMIPASLFLDVEQGIEEEQENHEMQEALNELEEARQKANKDRDTPPEDVSSPIDPVLDRWHVTRIPGCESLVRGRYRYLLHHISANERGK